MTPAFLNILPAGKNETFQSASRSGRETLYGGLSVAPRDGGAQNRGRPGTAARTALTCDLFLPQTIDQQKKFQPNPVAV
jgi:hypothetical protein